jgi:hypothetical protein
MVRWWECALAELFGWSTWLSFGTAAVLFYKYTLSESDATLIWTGIAHRYHESEITAALSEMSYKRAPYASIVSRQWS